MTELGLIPLCLLDKIFKKFGALRFWAYWRDGCSLNASMKKNYFLAIYFTRDSTVYEGVLISP
jgi:hypothetical protein